VIREAGGEVTDGTSAAVGVSAAVAGGDPPVVALPVGKWKVAFAEGRG
jgi:hypothetical protein